MTDYLYVEQWPNGRSYIGCTISPERRHNEHISGRGSFNVEEEIEDQGGILPEMIVLAVFDLKVKYNCGTYEQVITKIAKNKGWDLIYEDILGRPIREIIPDSAWEQRTRTDKVKVQIAIMRADNKSYEYISDKFRVNKGIIYRIYKSDYEPKDKSIRRKLGLEDVTIDFVRQVRTPEGIFTKENDDE